MWAENYDRPLDDVFAIQSEIAKAIANLLQAKLSPSEKAAIAKPPTTDLTAYDFYLRAQVLFADVTDVIHAKEKSPQAERVLSEAVARDPHFLLAWCLLSRVHAESIGRATTTPRSGSIWPMRPCKRLCASNRMRAKPTSPWPITITTAPATTGAPALELATARRALPNNAEVFEYTGYIDRREGHWEEATRSTGARP